MSNVGIAARSMGKNELAAALADAHEYTWHVLADLDAAQWQVPHQPGINPPLWESAHVAWFYERWILRDPQHNELGESVPTKASLLSRADEWFDSAKVAHRTRWELELPTLPEVRAYQREVLTAALTKLAAASEDDQDLYFYRLALFHEDMHAEALAYMRQTLGYSALNDWAPRTLGDEGEVTVPAARAALGSSNGAGFVFDNEKWQHQVSIEAFSIDRAPVTNRRYAAYVEAGGTVPQRWRSTGRGWEHLWFGQWQPLPLDQPVCHVSAEEAERYCRWAGRRLPSAAQWEVAAVQEKIEWGNSVWEWTADPFAPYPGFSPDPYQDYSAPWFYDHREVRGGSFVTRARMHHPRYRNFYLPERSDIFVGFRTCAR